MGATVFYPFASARRAMPYAERHKAIGLAHSICYPNRRKSVTCACQHEVCNFYRVLWQLQTARFFGTSRRLAPAVGQFGRWKHLGKCRIKLSTRQVGGVLNRRGFICSPQRTQRLMGTFCILCALCGGISKQTQIKQNICINISYVSIILLSLPCNYKQGVLQQGASGKVT